MDKDLQLSLGLYGAIGFQLSLSVVLGWFAGDWLDGKWGTTPWLSLVGLLLGSIAGFANLLKLLDWKDKRQKNS